MHSHHISQRASITHQLHKMVAEFQLLTLDCSPGVTVAAQLDCDGKWHRVQRDLRRMQSS
jgi:hypothetical protein